MNCKENDANFEPSELAMRLKLVSNNREGNYNLVSYVSFFI